MARLVKCYGDKCIKNDIKHPKENVKKYAGKNYCLECYEKHMEMVKYRDKTYQVLTKEFGICTPLMKKNIKDFHEGYNWDYKIVLLLVNYMVNIKKTKSDPKYGIGFYANSYPEMIQYYKDKKKKEEANNGKVNKKRTIVLNEDRFGTNTYKKSLLVDMEDI